MKELRVLEAITPSRIGGAEVYVADLCEGLSALGAQVSLFCPEGRPFVDYAAGRGINCTTWKTHGKIDPVTVIKLARLIKSSRADVIHTHLSTASLLGAFAARLAGVPSIAHVHGMNSATCFKYSTKVIAVSQAVKNHLCAQGLPEEKVHVVHNGVDLAKFQPIAIEDAKDTLGLSQDTPVIGVFGRLSPEKGQKTALEALARVTKQIPSARMMVVGDGKDRDTLGELSKALEISSNVQFMGFNPDITRLMSACDVVLVPSIKEGFGLVAVNAMALERPVVATDVGGLPEIVVDGDTGLLVPSKDPASMATCILRLLDDQSLRDQMGKIGRMRAQEHFDLQNQIELVMEILGHTKR